ncbi:MAG: hypothetical protein ACRDS9_06540, partial [Pseudonocardiaceae bacterium]
MADSLHGLQKATEDLLVLVPGRYRPVLFQGGFRISLNVPNCISNNVVLLDRALAMSPFGRQNEISCPLGDIVKPAACTDVNFGGFVVSFRLQMVPKERQSAEAVILRDKLKALGYGSNVRSPSAGVKPVAGDESANSWILQLSSLPVSRSSDEVERARVDAEQKLGLPVRVLNSTDFASLNPGFWVLYHPGNYTNGTQALDSCAAGAPTLEGQCIGRHLSHDAGDRGFVCYPSSITGRQSRCVK